jgi:hypothetical protein
VEVVDEHSVVKHKHTGTEIYLGILTQEFKFSTTCEILKGGRDWRISKGFMIVGKGEKHFWRWCTEEEYDDFTTGGSRFSEGLKIPEIIELIIAQRKEKCDLSGRSLLERQHHYLIPDVEPLVKFCSFLKHNNISLQQLDISNNALAVEGATTFAEV